jgi:hypothetical protein
MLMNGCSLIWREEFLLTEDAGMAMRKEVLGTLGELIVSLL